MTGPVIRTPKRLGGSTANANQRKGRAHEAASVKTLGGRAVRGSGAGREKGDVRRVNVYRLECKTTKNRSYSLTREMIEKVEASVPAGSSEIPFMEIRVDDQSAMPKTCFVFPAWAGPLIVEALASREEGL
jgi:hypothetical protein